MPGNRVSCDLEWSRSGLQSSSNRRPPVLLALTLTVVVLDDAVDRFLLRAVVNIISPKVGPIALHRPAANLRVVKSAAGAKQQLGPGFG